MFSRAWLLNFLPNDYSPPTRRRARNKSPEHNLPCVLSREQATLVLRKNLADPYFSGRPCDISEGDDEEGVRPSPEKLAVAHSDGGAVAGATAADPTACAAAVAAARSPAGTSVGTTATATVGIDSRRRRNGMPLL